MHSSREIGLIQAHDGSGTQHVRAPATSNGDYWLMSKTGHTASGLMCSQPHNENTEK